MKALQCLLLGLLVHVGLSDSAVSSIDNEDTSASVPFDCGRPAVEELCHNDAVCDFDNGTCLCRPGFLGYDCSYSEDQLPTECEIECENGGTCLLDADVNTTKCFCPEAFWGERCEKKRVYHYCSHDRMVIHITPPAGFLGWVYVLDQEEDPACIFDADPEDTFTKELKFDSCGSAVEEINANGDALKTFSVIVQFDEMIVTEKDLQFEFVCLLPKSGSEIDDNLLPFESSNNDRPFKRQKVKEELNPVIISLTTLDGQQVTSPQVLGTKVKLNFKLNGGDVYDNFRVEQITVTNGQLSPKRQAVDLLVNSCVPRRAFAVVDFGGDPTDELSLVFRVFKLRYSDSLHFETKVKLCKGDGCNATDCGVEAGYRDDMAGLGRRRRSLAGVDNGDDRTRQSTDNVTMVIYEAELRVWYPNDWTSLPRLPTDMKAPIFIRSGQQMDSASERRTFISCLEDHITIFVVAGLVIVVVVVLLIVIVVVAVRHRQKMNTNNLELISTSK